MIRDETKRWFKTSKMHFDAALSSIRSCIGDFLFGVKMLTVDIADSTIITIEYFLGKHQGWGRMEMEILPCTRL